MVMCSKIVGNFYQYPISEADGLVSINHLPFLQD